MMTTDKEQRDETTQVEDFKPQWVWLNVFAYSVLHLFFMYGAFTLLTLQTKWQTFVWMSICIMFGNEGVTMGAHRLWSHKSFSASTPLKILLLIAFTTAGENSCFIWSRDHRLHHKHSDTDADPHNSTRGFFYSHMGWLMMKKHPLCIKKGREIDLSDLKADYWVMFQYRHFLPLYFFLCSIITFIPYFAWGETCHNCIFVVYFLRWMVILHGSWSVNSVAHFFGTKPYSKDIRAVQVPIISFFGGGEGWHNYHHTFPWDYKTAEFGTPYNYTRTLIEWSAKLGYADNLKYASPEFVEHRMKTHGDGSWAVTDASSENAKIDYDIYDLYGEKYFQNTKRKTRRPS